MRKYINILLPIIICFGVGFTASYFQSESIEVWYPTLVKSSLTPPNSVFPIAWGIIYICMGISIGLILNSKSNRKSYLILLFIVQLLFNFTWSISFFYLQNPLSGFVNIILLYAIVVYYMFESYPQHKASALLFVPYILWLTLATYLNGYILVYN